MQRRPLVIMAVSFALVLMAGMAIAQVGAFAPTLGEQPDAPILTSGPEPVEPLVEPEKPTAAEEMPAPRETPADVAVEEPALVEEPSAEEVEEPSAEEVEEPTDTTPPKLEIMRPGDGEHFTEKTLRFSGITEPGARVFAGKYEADVLDGGEWHIVLILSYGRNLVTLTAEDAAGNTATASVAAYLDEPAAEFTAHQKYGSCSDPIPHDKFYGTGTPGTKVKVSSEHGSASTNVGESGEWLLEVTFPTAPYGKAFPVTVRDSLGRQKVFEFTSYSKGEVEFTVNQKLKVSGEPWEKFFGTANPGTVIEVMSEYGSARTVTEGYEWWLKVHFEGLTGPATFPIVLETSAGHRHVFEFTYQPAPIEFTAHQRYGSCSEIEPYDVFYGTARPGSTVTVMSDHGSGTTVAGDLGKWDLKVFFPSAPPGVPFAVTVMDAEGHQQSFEFVALP